MQKTTRNNTNLTPKWRVRIRQKKKKYRFNKRNEIFIYTIRLEAKPNVHYSNWKQHGHNLCNFVRLVSVPCVSARIFVVYKSVRTIYISDKNYWNIILHASGTFIPCLCFIFIQKFRLILVSVTFVSACMRLSLAHTLFLSLYLSLCHMDCLHRDINKIIISYLPCYLF